LIADIVIAAVLLISGVLALFRGFVKESLTIIGWIGAIFITLYGYQLLAPLLADFIKESWIAEIVAAAGLFLVSLIILTILSHMISSRVQGSMLGHLDRALGFVFGLVRGLALVCLVYLGGTLVWDEDDLPEQIEEARTLPVVKAGADFLASLAPEGTFPGRDSAQDQIDDTVDDIREGVEGMVEGVAKEKLEEMIEEIDAEERLRRLNQPEPETAPPGDPEAGTQATPEGEDPNAPAEALPAPPGYEDKERSDMQRLIESNQ
jgi:membrane protein required for colicin V production